jgi:tetratricopeptide (TPR) repeat protein
VAPLNFILEKYNVPLHFSSESYDNSTLDKYMQKLIILTLLIITSSCSTILSDGASIQAYNAHKRGNYKKAIQLVSQALEMYEYSNEAKANMLFIKAESYARINEDTSALGVLTYIISTYPNSEAAHKASVLLMSVDQSYENEKIDNRNDNPVLYPL